MMPPAATTNPRRTILAAVLALCGSLNAVVLTQLARAGGRLNSDFMAFWSFPRFAVTHDVRLIYNAASLNGFQKLLYPGFGSFYPYLYPPTLLLPSWWLRFFTFGTAELLWTSAGLLLLAAAVPLLFPRHRLAVLFALLASPAALINAATGETAFFTTALALAGFGLLPRRPLLAGVAFGLLTLKPQLGVLIPVFLLVRGEWRAIAAACLTAGTLAALSCLVFPAEMWRLWVQTLPQYQAEYFNATSLNLNIIVTPAANLVVLGLAPRLAWAVQLVCGLGVAALVAWMARRAPYNVAVAVLLAGTFLAQPHAYAYDSVLIPAAMALCLSPRLPVWMLVLGILIYLMPLMLLSPWAHWFLYAPPLALLLAALTWLALQRRTGAESRHEPVPISI
jgi:Glycosyltransferase family 87